MNTNKQSDRVGYLDSLRGLAALSVACIFHYGHFSSQFQPRSQLFDAAPLWSFLPVQLIYKFGGGAVDLFFVLSGIIFCLKYRAAIVEGRITARRFAVYRFARLYPLHLLTLIFCASVGWMFFSIHGRYPLYNESDAFHFGLNVLFLQYGIVDKTFSFNGPSWSLTIEAVMYLLFWITCRSAMTTIFWIFLSLGGVAIAASGLEEPIVNLPMARGLFGFFLGCLLQLAMSRISPRLVIALSASQLAALVFLKYFALATIPLYLCWSALSAFLISVISASHFLKACFDIRPFRFLGDISLSMYLIHVPVQFVILLALGFLNWPIPFSSGYFMAAYALLVMGASAVVYRYYEMPAQRLIRARLA